MKKFSESLRRHVQVPMPATADLLLVQEAPAPEPSAPVEPAPRRVERRDPTRPLRALQPHEVGAVNMPKHPEVPYSPEAFAVLMSRVQAGCKFMIEHIADAEGDEQIGFLADLLEAASCMAIGHMAARTLKTSAA